jgi:hypothetical protein
MPGKRKLPSEYELTTDRTCTRCDETKTLDKFFRIGEKREKICRDCRCGVIPGAAVIPYNGSSAMKARWADPAYRQKMKEKIKPPTSAPVHQTKYQIPFTRQQPEYSRALYLCQRSGKPYPELTTEEKEIRPVGRSKKVVAPQRPVISDQPVGLYRRLMIMQGEILNNNIIHAKCHSCHSDFKFPNMGAGTYQVACQSCFAPQLVRVLELE